MVKSYAICTTPRCGGQFLDSHLTDAGLGRPDEYFQKDRLIGIPWDGIQSIWDAHTVNDIFAVRLHWDHRDQCYLFPDFYDALPPGEQYWIHLYRQDLCAQAQSWLTAMETGVWSIAQQDYLKFSNPLIIRTVTRIQRMNEDWTHWLECHHRKYIRLCYEDIVDSPVDAVNRVRDHLKVS